MRMDELIANGIVPHLERKIRHINTTVVAQKKSVSNRLKSLFTTKKADDTKFVTEILIFSLTHTTAIMLYYHNLYYSHYIYRFINVNTITLYQFCTTIPDTMP